MSNWFKFILPFRQKTATQYLPIMPRLSPKLSFVSIIYSTKVELRLMNIQIYTSETISVKRKIL